MAFICWTPSSFRTEAFLFGVRTPHFIFGSWRVNSALTVPYPTHDFFPTKTFNALLKADSGLDVKKNEGKSRIVKLELMKSNARFWRLFNVLEMEFTVTKKPSVALCICWLPMMNKLSGGAILNSSWREESVPISEIISLLLKSFAQKIISWILWMRTYSKSERLRDFSEFICSKDAMG